MSSPFHRRHDRLHRLRQAYREQSRYVSQLERSLARWKRAALYRSSTNLAEDLRWFAGGVVVGLVVVMAAERIWK
jgi:hypothetical protein